MKYTDIMILTCPKCGTNYQITVKAYKQRERRGSPQYCKECIVKAANERSKQTKANMSPERKAQYSERISQANKKYWASIDQETKEKRYNNLRRQNEELQADLNSDPTKRAAHTAKIMSGKARMTEDQIADMKKKMSEAMTRHHAEKTPEQQAEFSERVKAGMAKMTDQEKEAMTGAWWNWWDGMTEQEQSEHMHKSLIQATGENGFSKKFKYYFDHSILADRYQIVAEYISTTETGSHRWDYAIFSKDTLIGLIDLDGAYYHADDNDYDGLHSHEEYDEVRLLSVPEGVKWFIIQERNFTNCFSDFVKRTTDDYDTFLDGIFKMCRNTPFPIPHYSNLELIQSYQSLQKMKCDDKYHQDMSLNTRIGDRLINHFHGSIWSAHRKGKPSPHEAWHNDKLLGKVIKNRTIYQTRLNPNKILQGFNVSRVAPKVTVFSAAKAKMIIHRYLNEYQTIFDPFSGFSGRMLGAVALGKDYIGQDISEIHVRESNAIINFLREAGFHINAEVEVANVLTSYGTYDCLFTCPPYGDKEQWLEVPVDTRSCDEWITICLEHFKCHRYVFVVDETIKYKEYIVDEIKNKSHVGSKSEWVLSIDR